MSIYTARYGDRVQSAGLRRTTDKPGTPGLDHLLPLLLVYRGYRSTLRPVRPPVASPAQATRLLVAHTWMAAGECRPAPG